MKTKHFSMKSVISMLLAVILVAGTLPVSVFAAQKSDYEDPADNWLKTNNRTNELDMNATVTYETQWCPVCNKHTTVLTYRVPEYTKSGQTAMNHGVKWSDGYDLEGKKKGNTDSGTPGVDASYTGYHYTKSVCQTCGTINSVDGSGAYNFNNNVYGLNSCDHNFFIDFDNTTYEPYDEHQHTTVLKKGEYCQFCKGTYARATTKKESHDLSSTVDGQVGNNRFYLTEKCDECGFTTSEYVAAKSVVSSYYGTADGDAHTVSVSDLSDSGVHTKIRYGKTASDCYMTSAPNYTKAGYYPVYYEISYKYGGETMVENGVSYVWLLEDKKDDNNGGTVIVLPEKHEHDYRYLETVAPSCDNLGYERWQCDGCGNLDKRNYTKATGHNYKVITIREATCKQGGLKLNLCDKCGSFYEESTPTGEHKYKTEKVQPTCRMTGYTNHTCEICGNSYITDMTPIISHAYERITKEPTCTDKGYTTSTCTMCGQTFVSDYTEPTGHDWDEGHSVTSSTCTADGVIEYRCKNNNCSEKMIKAKSATGHTPGEAATCTEPQTCEKCGTVLALPKGHSYSEKIVAPTCTAMGYTEYKCDNCDDSYVGDYTDKAEHDYKKTVTAPSCTAMGYTTYTCKNCDDEFISDYTDKLSHNYKAEITKPTCMEFGFTTYTCAECGDSYVADYTDKTEHNYDKKVIPPTCTEHGYTVYTCPDCGKEYIGDLTDCEKHTYKKTVVPPTCTEMGYTIYTCESCGDSYKADYVDKAAHDYTKTVTAPTCTALGYTVYECKNCDYKYISDYTDKINHSYIADVTAPTCTASGYTVYTCENCGKTYTADYKDMLGHKPSEWIIDEPATIEHAGEKHIECITCGEVLSRAAIPQLIEKDRTDEDGNSKVGDFSILVTNKDGKPIFDSEISIDINDNVTIKLPSGRLLDYADQTIITAINTDTQQPKSALQIFVYDENNNAATGKTDENGQLKVPNNKTSTGDNSGTVGKDDEDKKNTFVVKATDKMNVVIPNCEVYIGESNNIVVDLPEGIKPTSEYPVIITVTDQHGQPQQGVTVITLGDADYIEKGVTDMFGKITLPTAKDGFTDDTGKVRIDGMYVFVNDKSGAVENAFVKLNDDSTISVTLPDGTNIDYANRITVTVTDKDGNPQKDISVTVSDTMEKSLTDKTDENGKMVVPPLSEDITDSEGKAKVNGYNVLITDETKPIENAFVTIGEGQINVMLPDGVMIDIDNRITATITDSEDKPVKDMTVIFTDKAERTESNVTDENGRATVPPTNIDATDFNGYGEVDGYIVTVKNTVGAIEKAHIKHNAEIKNEDGSVKSAENISVELPEDIKFDYANRITISVSKKADNTAVKGMTVVTSEFVIEGTETKSLTGVTDKDGVIILPPASEGVTDKDGKTDISETIPGKDTDSDGKEDTEESKTEYNITVEDTKGKIENAYIEIKDGKITVTLPDTHTLTTSNQTTVTVLDKENKGVANVSVTVTDKNKATATKSTDTNGKVTLPVKSSGGGSSSGGGGRGGSSGGSYISSNITNITVTDKNSKTVSVSKSTDKDGKITLTLPNGTDLTGDNYYTIKATDNKGNAKADVSIILKDRKNNSATGTTDKNGMLVLPASEHKAYIFGYNDGTFRPDNNMSRAEAAAIFARLISEKKGENISGKANFKDISTKDWFEKEVGYLAKYGIIKGYSDNTFKPNESVTRAEFVAMTVRFNALFNDVKKGSYTVKYTDVASNYWAYSDIAYAKHAGWLNGYADGTFKGDNAITRAEVVTVVNKATGRIADEGYINKNLSLLNKFTDLKNNLHWAFYAIAEASNTHLANTHDNSETWVK